MPLLFFPFSPSSPHPTPSGGAAEQEGRGRLYPAMRALGAERGVSPEEREVS